MTSRRCGPVCLPPGPEYDGLAVVWQRMRDREALVAAGVARYALVRGRKRVLLGGDEWRRAVATVPAAPGVAARTTRAA